MKGKTDLLTENCHTPWSSSAKENERWK